MICNKLKVENDPYFNLAINLKTLHTIQYIYLSFYVHRKLSESK